MQSHFKPFDIEKPWAYRVADEIKFPFETPRNIGGFKLKHWLWPDGLHITQSRSDPTRWEATHDVRVRDVADRFASYVGLPSHFALILAQAGFGPGAINSHYEYPDDDMDLTVTEQTNIWLHLPDEYYNMLMPMLTSPHWHSIDFADGTSITRHELGKRYLGTHMPLQQHGPQYQYKIHWGKQIEHPNEWVMNTGADAARFLCKHQCGPFSDPTYRFDFSQCKKFDFNLPQLKAWAFPDNSFVYLVTGTGRPLGVWYARTSINQPPCAWTFPDRTPVVEAPCRWMAMYQLIKNFKGPSKPRPRNFSSADVFSLSIPDTMIKPWTEREIETFVGMMQRQHEAYPGNLVAMPNTQVVHRVDLGMHTVEDHYPDMPAPEPPKHKLNSPLHDAIVYPEIDINKSYANLVKMPTAVFEGTYEQACTVIIGQLVRAIELALEQLNEWDEEVCEQRVLDDNVEAGMAEIFEIHRIRRNYERFYTAYKARFTFPHWTPVTEFHDTIFADMANHLRKRPDSRLDKVMADAYLFHLLQEFKPLEPCPVCRAILSDDGSCGSCHIKLSVRSQDYLASTEFSQSYQPLSKKRVRKMLTQLVAMIEDKVSKRHVLQPRDDGLALCTVCGGAEASLPTHCPGRPMTQMESDSVQHLGYDYFNGEFVKKEKR